MSRYLPQEGVHSAKGEGREERMQIGVIGASRCSAEVAELAEAVGREI